MLEKYTKELSELADWYVKTKELVIKVENVDYKSYIQPMHELRYSYDHLMRAINYELVSPDTSEEKIERAIRSAKGHLVRAYSDCIEWLLVEVKSEFNRVLQTQKMTFTHEEILTVLPDYKEIKSQMQELIDIIGEYKIKKQSEASENFNPVDELQNNPLIKKLCGDDGFFDGKYADLLRKYLDRIHTAEPEFASMKHRKRSKTILKNVIIPICTCVLGGLIVFLITKS